MRCLLTRVLRFDKEISKEGGYDMAEKIPAGITPAHVTAISELLKQVRGATGADQAGMRLNESGAGETAIYVVIGWVEGPDLESDRRNKNKPDPGLYRFGDRGTSEVYSAALTAGKLGHIEGRDWNTQLILKRHEAKSQAQKAGIMYQKFIGITIEEGNKHRCVGTVTVGFKQKPNPATLSNVDQALKDHAQNQQSDLIQFLIGKKTAFEVQLPAGGLEFSGPTF